MNFNEYSKHFTQLTQKEDKLNKTLRELHQAKTDVNNKVFEEHLFQVTMYDLICELSKTHVVRFSSSHITFSKNGKILSLPESVFNSHYALMQKIIEDEKVYINIFLDIKGRERPTQFRRRLRATATLANGEYIAKRMKQGNLTTNGLYIPHLGEADALNLTYNFHPDELAEDPLVGKAVIACIKRKEAYKEQLNEKH